MFSIQKTDSNLQLSGKTFPVKETIKTLGGQWNPKLSVWSFPLSSNESEILSALESAVKLIAAEKKKAREEEAVRMPTYWRCCESAKMIDAKRGFTSCEIHAIGGNSFRVRGAIFTGD